jgi:hypothetical protein
VSNPEALYWSYAQTRAWVALRDHEVVEQAETHPDQAGNLSLAIHKALLDPAWRGQPGPDADQQCLAALQTGELRSWRINGHHSPEIPAEQWAGLLALPSMENVTFNADEVHALWPAPPAAFDATAAYEKRLAEYQASHECVPTRAKDEAWGIAHGVSRDCVRKLRHDFLPANKSGRPKKPGGELGGNPAKN